MPVSCHFSLQVFNMKYDGKKTSKPCGTTGQNDKIVRPSELMYFGLFLQVGKIEICHIYPYNNTEYYTRTSVVER